MAIFIAITAGLFVLANLGFKRISIATVATVLASAAIKVPREAARLTRLDPRLAEMDAVRGALLRVL